MSIASILEFCTAELSPSASLTNACAPHINALTARKALGPAYGKLVATIALT